MAKTKRFDVRVWSDAYKRFQVVCRREGKTVSQKVREWILVYLKEHEGGNPQTLLVPSLPKDSLLKDLLDEDAGRGLMPLERRKENVDWVESFVRGHPGRYDLGQLVHAVSRTCGVKPETAAGYVKTLRILKILVVRYGKVYTYDTLPPST